MTVASHERCSNFTYTAFNDVIIIDHAESRSDSSLILFKLLHPAMCFADEVPDMHEVFKILQDFCFNLWGAEATRRRAGNLQWPGQGSNKDEQYLDFLSVLSEMYQSRTSKGTRNPTARFQKKKVPSTRLIEDRDVSFINRPGGDGTFHVAAVYILRWTDWHLIWTRYFGFRIIAFLLSLHSLDRAVLMEVVSVCMQRQTS